MPMLVAFSAGLKLVDIAEKGIGGHITKIEERTHPSEADHVWSSEAASGHLSPEDSLQPSPQTASGDFHAEVK